MPTTPPPPPRRSEPKGEPPERTYTRRNLAKPEPAETVALNFRVPAEFKRDFKIAAATQGITQSELCSKRSPNGGSGTDDALCVLSCKCASNFAHLRASLLSSLCIGLSCRGSAEGILRP